MCKVHNHISCSNFKMNTSFQQKYKFFALIQRDAKRRKYFNEYKREYRRKKGEQGIHELTVISKNNTQNVYTHLYKQNAILCIKFMVK